MNEPDRMQSWFRCQSSSLSRDWSCCCGTAKSCTELSPPLSYAGYTLSRLQCWDFAILKFIFVAALAFYSSPGLNFNDVRSPAGLNLNNVRLAAGLNFNNVRLVGGLNFNNVQPCPRTTIVRLADRVLFNYRMYYLHFSVRARAPHNFELGKAGEWPSLSP